MNHLINILKNNHSDDSDEYFKKIIQEHDTTSFMNLLKQALDLYHGETIRNRYMLTVTIDPKKHSIEELQIWEPQVEYLIRSQVDRPGLGLIEYAYTKEHHKNGYPHWHIHIVSNKNLKKDFFKTFSRNYGHIDLSKSKCEGANHYDTYCMKEGVKVTMM